ncbi:MAG TPA: patatin-like phospholipase family protein [Acidobacteriota bacterium]
MNKLERKALMKVAKMNRVSPLAGDEFTLRSCPLGIGATAIISQVQFAICWIMVLLFCIPWANAQGPCDAADRRALILSGGGVKGAFEAGAVYHLVVLRGCDFQDFAGISVGALSSAFLAQAAPSNDPVQSQAALARQAEQLVSLWQGIKGPNDIMKGRKLGAVRFFIFGAESLNDFTPLRRLIQTSISAERLENGRAVRVGVTDFLNGSYREFALNGPAAGSDKKNATQFIDFVFASAVLPVVGRMPRIKEDADAVEARQFGDASLRVITPIQSYFRNCVAEDGVAGMQAEPRSVCQAMAHDPLQQLFVVVTSPYDRSSDRLPVRDPNAFHHGTRLIENGKRVLMRTLMLQNDTVYRSDLTHMLAANDALRGRWEMHRQIQVAKPEAETSGDSPATTFPWESYNLNPASHSPTRPYTIGLIMPEKETADISDLLTLSPSKIAGQLYDGCIAADRVMTRKFGLPSLAHECSLRFQTDESGVAIQDTSLIGPRN